MVQNFSFEKLDIEGLTVINPFFCEDNRGNFTKSYERDIFFESGLETDILEEFESWSKKGVIRGLHFQTKEPQSKIIKTLVGEIYDVAVDLRKNSKTYGEWRGIILSEENKKSLYIPAGCAHGFMTLSENALVSYKCTGKYLKEFDTGIKWDDKDIGIKWPINLVEHLIISERDSNLQYFKEFYNEIN